MSNDLVPTILVDQEIAAIESEMGNRGSDYWKNPAKQARVLSLYAQRNASGPAGYSDPTILLPIDSEVEFRAYAPDGDYGAYLNFMRVAADIVLPMPDDLQASFIASVEALPPEVAAAAIGELLEGKPAVDWSDDADVQFFATLPEGSLVREWGHNARYHHAVVRERLLRVVDELDEPNAGRFLDWHASLPTGAKVALYRRLAA